MTQNNPAKVLETYINKSTSENLQYPDSQMFIEICNIINSRSDMPKLAVQIIKKRLATKTPKTVYLCLELLEVAANACELPFHNQIANKEFLLVLSSLISKDMDKTCFEKLCHVVKYWTQLFDSSKDILPGFFEFHQALSNKGVQFPSKVDSQYAYLLKSKPKQKSSNDDFKEVKEHKVSGSSGGSSRYDEKPSGESKKSSKGMNPKLKKDFELVRENIVLTNEMIDNHDMDEDVSKNDVLSDLIQTLSTMGNKLQDFVQKQTEEETLDYCLTLNLDLMATVERYNDLKKGRRPKTFISANQESVPGYSKPTQKIIKDSSFEPDTWQAPTQSKSTKVSSGLNVQNTQANNKKQIVNLFDDDDGPTATVTQQTTQSSFTETKKQSTGFDDWTSGSNNSGSKKTNGFDDWGTTSSNTTQQIQQPQQQQQPQQKKIDLTAESITSLYKNPDTSKTTSLNNSEWDLATSNLTLNTQQQQGGWGQNTQQQGGWGQNTQQQQQGGWGQNTQQQGGWGQNTQQQGGWGQNTQQTTQQQGWGGNQQQGWGQNTQQTTQQQQGWGTQQQGGNNGWGNQQSGGWGQNTQNTQQNQGWGQNTQLTTNQKQSGGWGTDQQQSWGGSGGNQGWGTQQVSSTNPFNTGNISSGGSGGSFGGGNGGWGTTQTTTTINNGNMGWGSNSTTNTQGGWGGSSNTGGQKKSNPFDMSDLGTNLGDQNQNKSTKNNVIDLF